MNNRHTAENSHLQPIAKSKKSTSGGQSRWQLLVISGASSNPPAPKNIRVDMAHAPQPPHLPLGWSQQVGWHSALAATPIIPLSHSSATSHNSIANNSIANNSIATSGRVAAPKFLIAGKNQIAASEPGSGVVPVSGRFLEIEERLLELAQQLAQDIGGPLEASHQIITNLRSQMRVNSYLSMDDAQQLANVSRNLELISQWTECILLSRRIDEGGLQVVRSRFAPEQWRESIAGVLDAIARPKNIRIHWVGWDAQLPLLYLDSNHLTRAVLNLVANAIAASEPDSVVNIRASWQHNVTGRLMITIEDNGIGLPQTLMKVLNSAAADNLLPAKGNGLQAARQLISGIGGLIAAQHGPHSGTIFRISLPVDTYASVIRAWILQNATTATSSVRYRVALFAVRSGQVESNLFNSHLQKSATARQFVYRVADNRWLVLELKSSNERSDSTLMAAAEQAIPARLQDSQPWLSQSVFVSQPFALDGLLGRTDSELRLPQLTEQLVEKFEELLADQQPAMDRLTISEPAIPSPHFSRPQSGSAGSQASSSRPDAGEAEPGFQTANEIVKQWKLVQAKLALLSAHPVVQR